MTTSKLIIKAEIKKKFLDFCLKLSIESLPFSNALYVAIKYYRRNESDDSII